MKYLLALSLLVLSHLVVAQDQLITVQEIELNERKLIKTIEKFQNKPTKEKLKENFINDYEKFRSEHRERLIAINSDTFGIQNWEGLLNEMRTLQYIGSKTKASAATDFVAAIDYSGAIDSIINTAAGQLYDEGKEALTKKTLYATAYRCLKRASDIFPGYLNTRELLQQTITSGARNVFFAPVTYDNLGNFVEFGNKQSSMSSEFIIHSIIKDLSSNIVGATLQTTDEIRADWVVTMKWVSVNSSAEQVKKYTHERSSKIKENGIDVTVKATVNYVERSKNVSGTLSCTIVDKKKRNVVMSKTLTGSVFLQKKEATYTGDSKALTTEDLNAIKNTGFFAGNDGYEMIRKIYIDGIHLQLLNSFGPYLNWNYGLSDRH